MPRCLASTATFPAVTFQGRLDFGAAPQSQFGIATNLADASANSIVFSTEDTTDTLFARVVAGGAATVSRIGPVPDGMHMYHVQPVQGGFAFCVDNVVAATVPAAVPAGDFRAVVSTRSAADDPIVVDSINVKAYHGRAQATSSVFDAGRAATWGTASWTGDVPAGTQIVVETSSGNFATVDGSWSSWSAVGTNGNVASPSARYLRYRVTLVTADPNATPVLRDVSVQWY